MLLIRSVSVPGTQLDVTLATQVGAAYDAATVTRDVKTLWSTGRFQDVRAEVLEDGGEADIVFRVSPEPQYPLHEVRLQPHPFGLEISLPAGTIVTARRVQELATLALTQLRQRGYARATVAGFLRPLPSGKADVLLEIAPGEALKLQPLGDTALKAPRWYSREAVDAHAARLRARWVGQGYFDARVEAQETLEDKRARVEFRVDKGPLHHALDTKALCSCLFAERRAAERRGILDFEATVQENGAWSTEPGRAYVVGRIRFLGHPHYSDSFIRRHFLLDEGAPLDSWLLRESVVRLDRSGLFEPVDERRVHIATNAETGIADITVSLLERRRGSWSFSGPLPLSGSIQARLPAWGAGVMEASTYTLGFHVLAYSTVLKLATGRRVLPILSLDRPFTPAGGWLSGLTLAPQLGPRWLLLHYAGAQLEGRLGPWLAGSRAPDIVAGLQRPSGEPAPILCESPRPRFRPLRIAGGAAIGVARTILN